MHRTERTGASPQSSLKFIFPRVRSIWSAFRSAGEGISCRTRSTSRIANRFPPPAEEVRRRNTSKRTLETRRTRGFERVTNQGTPYNCSSFFFFLFSSPYTSVSFLFDNTHLHSCDEPRAHLPRQCGLVYAVSPSRNEPRRGRSAPSLGKRRDDERINSDTTIRLVGNDVHKEGSKIAREEGKRNHFHESRCPG